MITDCVGDPMPKIKLPGKIGKWTKQNVRRGGEVLSTSWYFPIDHGFGLKVRRPPWSDAGKLVWTGSLYSWPQMVNHELDGTEHADLDEVKMRTQQAAVRYFSVMREIAGRGIGE